MAAPIMPLPPHARGMTPESPGARRPDAPRPGPTKDYKAYLVAASTILLLFVLWVAGDNVPVDQKILATCISLLAVLPFIQYFASKRKPIFPLMATNSLFYLIAFGINGFYHLKTLDAWTHSYKYNWEGGLIIGIVGLASQILGYYGTRSLFGPAKPIRIVAGISSLRIRAFAWVLFGCHASTLLFPAIKQVPTLNLFLKVAPLTAMALLFMMSLTGKLSLVEKILLFTVVIPIELILRLNTGAVYEPILIFVLLLFIRWIVTGKSSVMILLAAFSVFMIFNPVKMKYREVVWYTGAGERMSPVDKLSLYLELAADYWSAPTMSGSDTQANLLTRLNHLALAAMVVEMTPGQVPYWNGETLELGLYAFIPRLFWPDKPKIVVGNEFGIRYSLLGQADTETTVNLTWVIELYCNYGYPAVVIGMMLIGVAFAWLERWFLTPGTALIDVVIPLSINFMLAYPESNIMLMWGGVINVSILFYVLMWMLKQ